MSSPDQTAELGRQVVRVATFAAEQELRVAKVVAEVGSGRNGHRKGLLGVLRSPGYGLARFGSEYIAAVAAVQAPESWTPRK